MVDNMVNQEEEGVKIVRTTSAFDCGGRCLLRFHVKDGKIIRIETTVGTKVTCCENCVTYFNIRRRLD